MAGQRINCNQLSDEPIERPSEQEPAEDPRGTAWYQALQDLEALEGEAGWAADTLQGIAETIERTHQVTEGQRRAIRNIEERVRMRRHGRSRRYEGWGGRDR